MTQTLPEHERKTKIVATLGPASKSPKVIRELLLAGVNVFRLNFSHGTHAEHARLAAVVRRESRRLARPAAILQDLQGPKIRTGTLAGGRPVELRDGDPFVITTRRVTGGAKMVSTTYSKLHEDVGPGDRLLVDDGFIELRVEKVRGRDVHCRVLDGGLLKEHKGINLPGIKVSAPSLTAKDREDAAFGARLGVDYVALSFVRRPEDVTALRRLLRKRRTCPPIIAKIEKPEALDCLADILAVADGVMVARGDLGVEVSPERVPTLQKRIIHEANRSGVLVITATQMLESMVANQFPTRAEAADVANAIYDGTDAVMLSQETAAGRYPVAAVRMMSAIAREAENSPFFHSRTEDPAMTGPERFHPAQVICRAAYTASVSGEAYRAIVVFTQSGYTAWRMAKQRPPLPVVALTPNECAYRQLALVWGVRPVLIPKGLSGDEMVRAAERLLPKHGCARKGDLVIVIAGEMAHRGAANMMKIHRL